jgi:sulfite reductase beta subunit-like hemoprotein
MYRIKVQLGDFYTDKARELAHLIKNYAANELRFTLRQDILIRHVKKKPSFLLPRIGQTRFCKPAITVFLI